MKTQILSLALIFILLYPALTRAESETQNGPVIYSGIVNSVPDGFNLPLIGFINLGRGSHITAQVGFVNTVKSDLTGTQVGFINALGGSMLGTQIGYVNTTGRDVLGGQVGFINTSAGEVVGPQIGFVNTAAKKSKSIQVGFVNTCGDSLKGAQIGFVNTVARQSEVAQVGFVNTARVIKGFQVGFINLADSIECGAPIGFLSIVKKGGYHALELSVTEMYPVNLSYKIGISRLYTTFVLSYDPFTKNSMAFGAGLGSVIPLGKRFSLVPEYISQNQLFNGWQQIHSLSVQAAYHFSSHFSVLAGPSMVWQYGNLPDRLNDPFFSFSKRAIDLRGNLITGARLAVRYTF